VATVYSIPNRPTGADTRSIAQILSNFDSVLAALNAFDGGNITPATFPQLVGWRSVLACAGIGSSALTAATWVFMENGGMAPAAAGQTVAFKGVYIDDADYTVSGKTTKLRLRAQLSTNATAPGVNFTFGLHVVTVSGGGAGQIQASSIGAAIAGSTVAINAPGGSSQNQGVSTEFNVPADGFYMLGVTPSGAPAANSIQNFNAQLQLKHV
jgi:hypothetical protein